MEYDTTRGGIEFIAIAKHLSLARGAPAAAAASAEEQRAPDRVGRVLRAAVGAGGLQSPTWGSSLTDYKIALAGFVESLGRWGTFDRLLADGVRRVPPRTRVVAVTSAAVGAVANVGAAKPVTDLRLAGNALAERKASVIVVASEELLRSPSSDAFLARELRAGVAAATDAGFLPGLVDGLTPVVTGSGSDAAAVAADIGAALELMELHAGSMLYLIVTPDTAARLAVKTTTDGVFAFPDMTPKGGTVAGIVVLASDSLPPSDTSIESTALLVDASGIVLSDETITLAAGRHASVEMLNSALTGSSVTATGTTLASMFATNCVALKAERFFAYARVRDAAVVQIDTQW